MALPLALPRLGWHRRHLHSVSYEGVLGTSLELQIRSERPRIAARAERLALAEIDRLEAVFSAYLPTSELSRWQSTLETDVAVSPELAEVLDAAEGWRRRTRGAFNPGVEGASRLWRAAEMSGTTPSDEALASVREELSKPLWMVDLATPSARRSTRLPITLNAIAKGFIVDAAAALVSGCQGVQEVVVNIGGDVRHIGARPLSVAIADPREGAENAPPLDTVLLADQAIATSGGYRRGVSVGDRWYSHLIDPRTARPGELVISASVIAPSAMVADVLATACGVLTPEEGVALCDSVAGAGCLLATSDGAHFFNSVWRSHSASSGRTALPT